MKDIFINAQCAFEYMFDYIINNGIIQQDTQAIKNIGFKILNPLDRNINTTWRKWSSKYAEMEWQWYLSENPSAMLISQHAKIWKKCMDENGNVNSNYGYQWSRSNQIQYVIDELERNPESRRANITLYDAKEHQMYSKDTPCTLSIGFTIENQSLDMSVLMRSNDLVYGFCNDQYCFSKLQEMIANRMNIRIGTYYHFTQNMHIYEKHFNIKNRNK